MSRANKDTRPAGPQAGPAPVSAPPLLRKMVFEEEERRAREARAQETKRALAAVDVRGDGSFVKKPIRPAPAGPTDARRRSPEWGDTVWVRTARSGATLVARPWVSPAELRRRKLPPKKSELVYGPRLPSDDDRAGEKRPIIGPLPEGATLPDVRDPPVAPVSATKDSSAKKDDDIVERTFVVGEPRSESGCPDDWHAEAVTTLQTTEIADFSYAAQEEKGEEEDDDDEATKTKKNIKTPRRFAMELLRWRARELPAGASERVDTLTGWKFVWRAGHPPWACGNARCEVAIAASAEYEVPRPTPAAETTLGKKRTDFEGDDVDEDYDAYEDPFGDEMDSDEIFAPPAEEDWGDETSSYLTHSVSLPGVGNDPLRRCYEAMAKGERATFYYYQRKGHHHDKVLYARDVLCRGWRERETLSPTVAKTALREAPDRSEWRKPGVHDRVTCRVLSLVLPHDDAASTQFVVPWSVADEEEERVQTAPVVEEAAAAQTAVVDALCRPHRLKTVERAVDDVVVLDDDANEDDDDNRALRTVEDFDVLDLALGSMRVGELAEVVVTPPELATARDGDDDPEKETNEADPPVNHGRRVLLVHLVKMRPAAADATTVQGLREAGTRAFSRKQFERAARRFREAASLLPSGGGGGKGGKDPSADDDKTKPTVKATDDNNDQQRDGDNKGKSKGRRQDAPINKDAAALQSNLAACYLELGRPRDVLAACDRALAADPDHAQALRRRAKALVALGELADAVAPLRRCLELDPDNAAAKKQAADLKRRLADRKDKQRKAYASALVQPPQVEKKSKSPPNPPPMKDKVLARMETDFFRLHTIRKEQFRADDDPDATASDVCDQLIYRPAPTVERRPPDRDENAPFEDFEDFW